MVGLTDIDYVSAKLRWMEASRIWPNGRRYLWTDAFGVVLLVSLYRHLNEPKYLAQAETVVSDAFVIPHRGVVWKMREDLSSPYPGYGFGALDAFDGFVAYRLLDPNAHRQQQDDQAAGRESTEGAIALEQGRVAAATRGRDRRGDTAEPPPTTSTSHSSGTDPQPILPPCRCSENP